ncbi:MULTISPECIES: hypothetical protein [unclassified Streptomyces]|uniref:hypothetical protein n=1 Tax=unclassified Streptomyces TaxID=2593676 RepID=UPI00037DA4B1|nr:MULTISPECIES: hypothetical protein [unclassified Streptomyces]MYX39016.1 hypothetical protein [Streptomyces sp. SID8377]
MTTNPPITLDPALDPWERQPKETPKKHGQFLTYRDLGRARTLVKAAEGLTLAYGHVRNVAGEFRWRERAEAHDRHLDRLYEAMWLEERRKAAETDAKLLGAIVGKLAQRLGSLNAAEMTVGDFVRLLDVAMRHRRVLFGDPTETIALTGQGGNPLAVQLAEFEQLPADQRRLRIADLAATVARRVKAVDGSDDEDDGNEGDCPAAGDEDEGSEEE